MKNKQEPIRKSECCNADTYVDGIPDFEGYKEVVTRCFICSKCKKPCDIKPLKQEPIEEAICLCDDMEDGVHSIDCDLKEDWQDTFYHQWNDLDLPVKILKDMSMFYKVQAIVKWHRIEAKLELK